MFDTGFYFERLPAPSSRRTLVVTVISILLALIATGLVLFVITLVVNSIARVVINRRKAFSGAN